MPHAVDLAPLLTGPRTVGSLLESNQWLYNFVGEVLQHDDLILRQSRERDIYDRMLQRDSEVAGAYEQLIWPILGSEPRVIPAAHDESSEGERRQKILTDMVREGEGYREVLRGILNIPWRGYGGVELRGRFGGLGEPRLGEPRLAGAVEIPPEALTFEIDGAPRLKTNAHPFLGVKLDDPSLRWKFIIAHWGSTKGGNWFGTGIALRIYWLWKFKAANRRSWNVALERHATPTLIARHEKGDFASYKRTMLKIFRDYVSEAGIVVPNGMNVELLGSPGGRSFPGYEKMDEVMAAAIRKGVLGVTLTMDQGDRGSQALGRVHARALSDRQWAVVQWAQDVLSSSLIRYLSEAEFGNYQGHRLEIVFEEREDERLRIEKLRAAQDLRLAVREDDIRELVGLPKPGDQEQDVIQLEPVAAAAPLGLPAPADTDAEPVPLTFAEPTGLVDNKSENRRLSEVNEVSADAVRSAATTLMRLFPKTIKGRLRDAEKKVGSLDSTESGRGTS